MANSIIGPIAPPPGISAYGSFNVGLVKFANNLLKFVIVVGGLYAFLNLILAGYQFMSAAGDPKDIEKAWAKIWQSLLGLLIVAGSFVLAVIFGKLLFNDPTFILSPKIYGPQ